MVDLSIIPEVIGESINGAARFVVGTGYNPLIPKQVTEKIDELVPFIPREREKFRSESLADQLSDAADFATMLPVTAYAGAALKAANAGRKAKKAHDALVAERAVRKARVAATTAESSHNAALARAAKKSLNSRYKGKPHEYMRLPPEEKQALAQSSVNYGNQIKAARSFAKKIKKGAKVAEKHSSTAKKVKKLTKDAVKKAQPSRSAIAGAVYQLSKNQTRRR